MTNASSDYKLSSNYFQFSGLSDDIDVTYLATDCKTTYRDLTSKDASIWLTQSNV